MIATKSKGNKYLIPAVSYIRMSNDKQETSPSQQREEVVRLADAGGYKLGREYVDEGISGDETEKRTQFKQMICDAEKGEFKAILCWDQDRFGRFDSIEAGRWIYPLRQAGVHLVTVAQGVIDWSDFANRMIYSIQQEAKHQYLRDLSRNVTRGMRQLADQGKWPGGKLPIGYIAPDGNIQLGPDEDVEFVRWLFREYIGGNSLRGIATILNKQGNPWTATGISGVLKNQIYTGDFRWNHTCQSKYKRNGRPEQRNNESDWIVIRDNHPAIIDRDSFERASRQLKSRKSKSTPHKNGGGFVFSGLLHCSKCGSKMIGDLANGIHHYTCYGYRERGKDFCDRNSLRQSEILAGVVDALEKKHFNPVTFARVRDTCRAQLEDQISQPNVDTAKRELAKLESKLEQAKRRLLEVDSDMVSVVQDHIRELTTQAETITESLNASQRPEAAISNIDVRLDRAMKWFERLQDACDKADSLKLRAFLTEAIERIDLKTHKTPWTAKRFKYSLAGGLINLNLGKVSALPHLPSPYIARFAGLNNDNRAEDRSDTRTDTGSKPRSE